MLGVGNLEPAELCANLPSPLAAVLIDIISHILELSSVVSIEVLHAHLICDLLNDNEPRHNWSSLNAV